MFKHCFGDLSIVPALHDCWLPSGVPKDFLGLLEGRQTYVIGKDGVVKAVYNNQFDPESHVEEALKALQS